MPTKLEVTQNLLSYTVVKDKQALVDLLNKNGVKVPVNPSDKEVLTMVLMASASNTNKQFKTQLAKLLTDMVPSAAEDFKEYTPENLSFTGWDDFGFAGATGVGIKTKKAEQFKNLIDTGDLSLGSSPAKSATTKEKTGVGKVLAGIGNFLKENVLTKENINAGIQIGLTSLNNKAQAKSNAIQAESDALTRQADEIRRSTAVQPKGMDTTTIIFIVAGVLALGGIIYVIAKKK